jgi:hypothetical protein
VEGWIRDQKPKGKLVRMLAHAYDARDGELSIGTFNRRESIRYNDSQRAAVVSLLEHDGNVLIWGRSDEAGLQLLKIDLAVLDADQVAERAKQERGLKDGEVIEGDFRLGMMGLEHCKGAEQPVYTHQSDALRSQFPHWPEDGDRECFRIRAKVVSPDKPVPTVRVLELTKDGVTEALPTDGVLRSAAEILAHGVTGSKARLRQCLPRLRGSSLVVREWWAVLSLELSPELREMVKALARRCVELQFTLTANPDARPPVRATVASGVQMAARGVLTAVHDRSAYDTVALSPSDAKWDAWWTEALRDWPKSKGRTYVLDDVARADMRHMISVPPALMTRFLSVTYTGDERRAKLIVALDNVDGPGAHLVLVKVVDAGLPAPDASIPPPREPAELQRFVTWAGQRGTSSIGEALEVTTSVYGWAGSRARLGYVHDVDLTAGAMRELEALVTAGEVRRGGKVRARMRHSGFSVGVAGGVRPKLVVETVSAEPSKQAKKRDTTPTLLALLRAGMAAKGRSFEGELRQGGNDRDGTVLFDDCSNPLAQLAVSLDRKDQWPLIDEIAAGRCAKVKFVVESVAKSPPYFRVRLLAATSTGKWGIDPTFALTGAASVKIGRPWVALAAGAWGQMVAWPRLPVWIPVGPSDSESRRWLEQVAERDVFDRQATVQTGSPKKHPSGFMYLEGQRSRQADPAPSK